MVGRGGRVEHIMRGGGWIGCGEAGKEWKIRRVAWMGIFSWARLSRNRFETLSSSD